jgi:hypothetical protein
MEVSMWRSKERAQASKSKADELSAEVESLKKSCEGLFGLRESNPLVAALWQRHAARLARIRTDLPAPETNASTFEQQVDEAYEQERHEQKVAKEWERKLCTLRDFVVNVWRIPEIAEAHADLAETVKEVTQKHLEHRKEDKATWVEWLAERRKFYRDLLREKNPASQARYTAFLKRVEEEQARMATLTDEQILLDCTLFGENPQDFDPLAD